jgi:hypothetical protein
MKSNTDFKPGQTFGLLLVGDPKTGKTRVAMSFPKPYFLDFDRNMDSAVKVEKNKEFWYDNPYVTDDGKPIDDKDLWEININQRLKAALKHPDIQTIVIDSLSTLAQALVYHIAHSTSRMEGAKQVPVGSELLADGNVRPGEKGVIGGLLRRQDYMIFQTMMTRLVAYMRGFPKLIIWTAHQKIREGDLSSGGNLTPGVKQFRINMPGALADSFGGFYSDVWGTYAVPGEPSKYFLQIAPSTRHTDLGTSLANMPAKIDCTGKLPSQIWAELGPKINGTKP